LTASLLGDTTESFFGTSSLYRKLTYSNTTKSFYFNVNDPTNLVDEFCLYVDQYNSQSKIGRDRICSNCVSASSGIAVCNVSAYVANGRELIATTWFHTNTEYSEYWGESMSIITDLEAIATFGTLGVFLGFMLTLSMFFAGLVVAGFGGAIIFFDIGLIFVSIMELVKIGFPVLLGVVAVSVLVLLILGDK